MRRIATDVLLFFAGLVIGLVWFLVLGIMTMVAFQVATSVW